MGGISSEREVSLASGAAVLKALRSEGFEVFVYDFDGIVSEFCDMIIREKPDLVFNILHGEYGEDGRVQGLLDMLHVHYTHSGFFASAACMDKSVAKSVLAMHGIKVPRGRVVSCGDFPFADFSVPYVLKPVAGGSSVDVHIVKEPIAAWPCAGDKALLEEYIPGRELTVAIFRGQAFGITEIVAASGFYDYDAKYKEGGARHVYPAELPFIESMRAVEIAERAYRIFGCSGLARADFRYDGRDFYFLEMNTQPGMTPLSLAPEQASASGISFSKLCRMMVEDAL
jgi:D-alanine-D-alanine ligase